MAAASSRSWRKGDGLGGIFIRLDVQVDDGDSPVPGQQLLVDEVDVGDFGGLLHQVGVVLQVEAVGHHHLGDGCSLLCPFCGNPAPSSRSSR